jgi:two-component system sensor histidine kinase/response regulator
MNSPKENKRISISIYITFAIVVLSVIYIILNSLTTHDLQKEILSDNAKQHIDNVENNFFEMSLHTEKLLKSIRHSKKFKEYLRGQSSFEETVELFKVFAESSYLVMQLRFLSQDGVEKIRVDIKNGHAKVTPLEKLQNKSTRYYFLLSKKEAIAERVWFSKFDLNRENGKIEVPYKPTVRGVLPVFEKGKFQGVLVVNIFAGIFLEHALENNFFDAILISNDGHIIYHHNLDKSWGYLTTNQHHIIEDFPEEYNDILNQEFCIKGCHLISKSINTNILGGVKVVLSLKENYKDYFLKQSYSNLTIVAFILIFVLIYIYIFLKYLSKRSRTLYNNGDSFYFSNFGQLIDVASKISKIGFWEYYENREELKWSKGVYDIFDIDDSNKKITFQDFLKFVIPSDHEKLNKEFISSIHDKREYFVSHKIITLKGNVKHVEERAIHFYDKKDNYVKSLGTVIDVTEQFQSEKKYQTILESATDGIHVIDKLGNIIEFSPSFAEMLGYKASEVKNMNIHDLDIFIPLEAQIEFLKDKEKKPVVFETRFMRRDGKSLHLQINARSINLEKKEFYYASMRDITSRKLFEKALIEKRDELALIFDTALECIALVGKNGKFIKFNSQCSKLLGFTSDELTNRSCFSIVNKNFINRVREIFSQTINESKYENFQKECVRKDGEIRIINSSIAYIKHREQFLVTMVDHTELHRKEEELLRQAYLDELTQLPNRKAFNRAMTDVLQKYNEHKMIFSIIILDIDFFKSINDTFGHLKGDEVLFQFSRIVETHLRGHDQFFRIGGEEFLVLLPNTNIKQAYSIANRMRIVISEKLDILEDKTVTISGGATEVVNGDTRDTIFVRADQNLYIAKNSGRNKVVSDIEN